MDKFSQAILEIDLVWQEFQGRRMTVEYQINHDGWCPIDKSIRFGISLPSQFKLRFSGKRTGLDTKVDSQGQILEDMAVIIKAIRLDGFPANHIFLHQRLVLDTESGDHVVSNFVGFNGTIDIPLAEPHVLGVISSWNI